MGDVLINMVRNVRALGFNRCWKIRIVLAIVGICIFMATTEAQFRNNVRNMRNSGPLRHGFQTHQSAQNNWHSPWNERQRMLQELERKIQEQKRLADEIARQQAELRRLQQNQNPWNRSTGSFVNNSSAITSPNGSIVNNNRQKGLPNRATPFNRNSWAANHFAQSSHGANNVNSNNWRQNSGENVRQNNNNNKGVFPNANGNMFQNNNAQSLWGGKADSNNNLQFSNPRKRWFRNTWDSKGINNFNKNNNNEFKNAAIGNANMRSTDVLNQPKTDNGAQNRNTQGVQGIPIPYTLHTNSRNSASNWANRNTNNHNKQTVKEHNARRIVNIVNKVNERNRNWQPLGRWDTHRSAHNRGTAHEEISVFRTPEARESFQVKDSRTAADSHTALKNSQQTAQKSFLNGLNPNQGSINWNRTKHITNGFKSSQPDTAIVLRYKDGKIQMGTDKYVKVPTNNVDQGTKSHSQTANTGGASKIKNAIPHLQPYSPVVIQRKAASEHSERIPLVLSRNNPRWKEPEPVPTARQQDFSKFDVEQTQKSPRIIHVLPSMGNTNSEMQPPTNVQQAYSSDMKVHQTSVQQPMVLAQSQLNSGHQTQQAYPNDGKSRQPSIQQPMVLPLSQMKSTHLTQQTYLNDVKIQQPSVHQPMVLSPSQVKSTHLTQQVHSAPEIVQTNSLPHGQVMQGFVGQQELSSRKSQIPIVVNPQPSISKETVISHLPNEQHMQHPNILRKSQPIAHFTQTHLMSDSALSNTAPVNQHLHEPPLQSTSVVHSQNANEEITNSAVVIESRPLVEVVNTKEVSGVVDNIPVKTDVHNSNEVIVGLKHTDQKSMHSQLTGTGTAAQLNEQTSSANAQTIQTQGNVASKETNQKTSPEETKQLLQTLLALLQGTNTQTTANVNNNNKAVAQTENSVASEVKVKAAIPGQNVVVQTLQAGQNINVQSQEHTGTAVPANPNSLNMMAGSNTNVASHTNNQHMLPAHPSLQTPFGHQYGHFGQGYMGMPDAGMGSVGQMWQMEMQNPAFAQQMWQQFMFGGDNIDIPDPPDPPPTMASASTTYGAAAPQPTGPGMMGPPKFEVEVEAPPVTTTTTVATTTTIRTTTTTPTTTTPAPKPKIKPEVKPKPAIKPDIINSIAVKLAALLGKAQGNVIPTLGQNNLNADRPVANLKSNGQNIKDKVQNVDHSKASPKQQTVAKNVQINSNYAKSTKETTIKLQNSKPLQLPVTFLSGKVPKERKIANDLVNTMDLSAFRPKVDPVLAGVDVQKVKAQQIVAAPPIVKTNNLNLNTLVSLDQFQPAHTYQPVVNVKQDSLNDITNVLTGKETLDEIVLGNAMTIVQSAGDASTIIHSKQETLNNVKNAIASGSVVTNKAEVALVSNDAKLTTESPTAVQYQNVAPAPSVKAEEVQTSNDSAASIQTAVVDLLSQIKQLWINADASTQAPTTTTTQRPCTPDSPDYSCEGVGMFANVKTIGTWCVDKCRAGACVESVCKCSCPSRAPGTTVLLSGTTESALGSLDRANTTDVPEEIEQKHFAQKTPAQQRRARRFGHLCHPLAMIHDIVCGPGPEDPQCPTGAKCIILPRGDNFCCWQDRELPGPAPQKPPPRKKNRRRLRKKWRRRPRHKRSTPIMSTFRPTEEEEEVELEDMVTTTAAMTTTPEFTTESPLVTSTYDYYYDVIEPLTTTVSFADVKLSARDVSKHADFKYDPSVDFVLSTPGFQKDNNKHKNKISPDKIHWGSEIKGRVKEKPRKKPVGPTSGYDVLGINPDTLGFVPDIERSSQWGRKKDHGAKRKTSRWNEPDGDENKKCTCAQSLHTRPPPSWNRRDGGWRDPPARADWRDPPPTDPTYRDPPPRDRWRDTGRRYDRWRDPPPTTERPWGSRWRDTAATREHGAPRDWQPRDPWGSRDRGRRRSYGLRNRWRETTTQAAGEEAEGPEAPD